MSLLRTSFPILRRTFRRPGLLAASVLALGIGLVAAMASLVDGVWLRGLPFPEGDRVVMWSLGSSAAQPTALEDFRTIRSGQTALEQVAAFRTFATVVTDRELGSRGTTASYVTPDLFTMLGVEPQLGRGLGPEDALPGAPPVVLLSHRHWHRHFGGDSGVLGRQVEVNRELLTVVGVMPRGSHFPFRQDLWSVLRLDEGAGGPGAGSGVFALGKLSPGVSPEEARRRLEATVAGLDESHPLDAPRQLQLRPYVDAVLDPRVRTALEVMMVAVLVVLLVAGLNVAALRVAEVSRRRDEMAVRRALGAGRGRVAALLLGETAVLAALGSAAGLGLAWLLVTLGGRALVAGGPLRWAFWIDLRLDARVALAAVAAGVLSLLLGGLLPLLVGARRDGDRLRSGRGADRGSSRLMHGLVAGQVAACLLLTLGAGLLGRSAFGLLEERAAMDGEALSASRIATYQADHGGARERRAFVEALLGEMAREPEVAEAAYATAVPWGRVPLTSVGSWSGGGAGGGAGGAGEESLPQTRILGVTSTFFRTLGLKLQQGRFLERQDQEAGAPVAVVSETFARHHFRGSALGGQVELGGSGGDRLRVVGVVADLGLDRQDEPSPHHVVYRPFPEAEQSQGFLLVRARTSTVPVAGLVDAAVTRADSRAAALDHESLQASLDVSTWVERRLALLFGVFAAAGFLLTMAGLYAVLRVLVGGRLREFGIRLAVGGRPADLRRLVLRSGALTLGAGLALGAVAALFGVPALESFLYGVEPWDPAVLAAVLAGLLLAALVASLGPALEAGRTDPVRSLRAE